MIISDIGETSATIYFSDSIGSLTIILSFSKIEVSPIKATFRLLLFKIT